MQVINGKDFHIENSCVTIGKFDGLHIGHQSLFLEMEKYKDKYPLVVFSFIFNSDNMKIYTPEKKIELLESRGIDYLINLPFDDSTKNMLAEDFIKHYLVDQLGTKVVIVGDNFRFGYNRLGDGELLKKSGDIYGFKSVIVPCIKYENENVSSSRIRKLINEGIEDTAKKLLKDDFWK